VRGLHAELETLAERLKRPVPPDPFQDESACRRAVEQAKALAQEMTATLSAEAPAGPIPERLDHFRILKLLGQGGLGAVYLAEDTRLGRQVALKTMRPELAAKPSARERFLREARLAAALEHDHICPIYHVGEADGIPYLAMPFLKGQSLEDLLKRKPKLAMAQVIRLGIQIAAGLAAAHDKGLIHRDIKPGNLWLEASPGRESGEGRVKILDFGLARSSEADTGVTQSGTILGTPAYMAPEQARGEKVDARADLYSLGVVLYRLATGELPLKGSDTMSMLMALATQTPRPAHEVNPEMPAELSAVIMRLLAKDPSQRPASARAVMQELRALQQAPADTIALPQPLPAGRGSGPRRRWPLIAAGLLFAFLGGGLLLGQIILRITDKDGKTRDIELKPGDRIEIVEKPTPKPDPAKAPPTKEPEIKIIAGDPNRRAAEYVLSIGGQVTINDSDRWLDHAGSLPQEPFRLTGVSLYGRKNVTDAGLAHFKGCRQLRVLELAWTDVTDAGLAYFKDCKALTELSLGGTRTATRRWGQESVFFETEVSVGGTEVTDAGLAYFKDCKDLTILSVENTRVTDAGLGHFRDCKGLERLILTGTRVTDAGLAHFKDCNNLQVLWLAGTRVTDAALADLASFPSLAELSLDNTRVSLAGFNQIRTAMPSCGIPWFEPNRVVAEEVLALGGTVEIGLKGQPARPVKAAGELPKELFQVRRVSLAGVKKPLDKLPELLAQLRFKEFDRLEKLDLSGISGVNYDFLVPIAGLEELSLAKAGLNDASLGQLPKLPALKRLVLDGNEIRGPGLAALSTQPALVDLSLGCPSLTDLFAKNLAELKQLKRLSLAGSGLGDAGIKHLEGLTNLEALDLRQTKVTAAGIDRLQKALPKCKIDWDGAKK
jgi:serine/threonine protein kinase